MDVSRIEIREFHHWLGKGWWECVHPVNTRSAAKFPDRICDIDWPLGSEAWRLITYDGRGKAQRVNERVSEGPRDEIFAQAARWLLQGLR